MWDDLEKEKQPGTAGGAGEEAAAGAWGGLGGLPASPAPVAGAWGGVGGFGGGGVEAEDEPGSFGALLHKIIRNSMEEMVFLPVEKRMMLVAALDVEEPVRGTIWFIMSKKQAGDVAMAMHNVEADRLTDQMTRDAVAELINTVAGQLASALLPVDQTFVLGLPRVEYAGHVEHEEPVRGVFLEVVGEIFQLAVTGPDLIALCDEAAGENDRGGEEIEGPRETDRMKTLIVEDDFTSRLLLQEILKVWGAAHVAVNGREALEAVRIGLETGEAYDLICMDIMMPELDGHKAVEGIRELERGMGVGPEKAAKVVMTSALGDMKSVMKAYGNFCDAYLVKPIRKDALLAELERLKLIDGPTARHGEKH